MVFEQFLITTFKHWDNLCFFNSHGTMPFSSDKLTMCVTGNVISYYKLEGNFFRHGRRTAPKCRTHVRIETRLALTYKQMTHPTPGGLGGYLFSVTLFVRPSIISFVNLASLHYPCGVATIRRRAMV